jgi:hypothetical protein
MDGLMLFAVKSKIAANTSGNLGFKLPFNPGMV